MQNKSAALSNRLLRGYFQFSVDEAVELNSKAQEGHGVRLFRGLSEEIIGKCLTVERVGYVEDPSLVSTSYEAVPELCRPVDIWHGSRTLRYGLWRS